MICLAHHFKMLPIVLIWDSVIELFKCKDKKINNKSYLYTQGKGWTTLKNHPQACI